MVGFGLVVGCWDVEASSSPRQKHTVCFNSFLNAHLASPHARRHCILHVHHYRYRQAQQYTAEVDPATLMATGGSSMGTDLKARVHASYGDVAVSEAPTYYLAHQVCCVACECAWLYASHTLKT